MFFDPFPAMLTRGEGARIWDEDGHSYIDLINEATAGVFGHSHPVIKRALEERMAKGWNLGGHTALEGQLANVIAERFPSMEKLRFVNSGTESNMFCIATAALATGRKAILSFKGCYHGGFWSFAGGTNPLNAPYEPVLGTYNDVDGTADLIEKNAMRLAAVIVEPMVGGGGCIPGKPEFLKMLREKTAKHGIVLIFDEVMCSRLSPGGVQAIHGIKPDLTSLGKYIGGGVPSGAFGGRADLMERYDPRRKDALPHSGTFNNNVISLSLGIAGLTKVLTPEVNRAMNGLGDRIQAKLNQLCRKHDVAMQFTGLGSLFAVHMLRGAVNSPDDASKGNAQLKELFFFDMLEHGVYTMPKRGMMCLSVPNTDADGDTLVAAVDEFVSARRSLLS
jgi:glutamate-1-semialdehyde 2,1-aminomutase